MKFLLAAALLAVSAQAHALAIVGQGTWETTLQARYLGGYGTPDAWFDTARNVTWMNGLGADFSGAVYPRVHVGTFAPPPTSFAVFNISGWRLPSTAELLSLRNDMLGNAQDLAFNSGGFDFRSPGNDIPLLLWTSDIARFRAQCSGVPFGPICSLAPDPEGPYFENARFFIQSGEGFFDTVQRYGATWVMGVHEGDIAPIPEPDTYALLAIGLLALVLWRRQTPALPGP